MTVHKVHESAGNDGNHSEMVGSNREMANSNYFSRETEKLSQELIHKTCFGMYQTSKEAKVMY